jgi:2-deoxy-D-gluconate 3-dehydrogenase
VDLDVLKEASCHQAVHIVERFGRLDILVNNTGTTVRKQPEGLTALEWHLVMDTNLTGAFLCSQAAYPHMVKAGGGKIINIGSMRSVFGAPYAAPYAARKGGIVQMARSMAIAWAKDNIQVNMILPGWVDTELTERHESKSKAFMKGCWRAPRPSVGAPLTISQVSLAAPASDFITGAAIAVDGGYSVQA